MLPEILQPVNVRVTANIFARAAETLFESNEAMECVGCCWAITYSPAAPPFSTATSEAQVFFSQLFNPLAQMWFYWWGDPSKQRKEDLEARILALLLADILFQEHLKNKSK